MPSTDTGSSYVILDNCPPVIPRSNSSFDIWAERTASACLFAPIIALPKIFEVLKSLKGFHVPPMMPETDVNDWGALTLPAEVNPLLGHLKRRSPYLQGLKVTIDSWLSDPGGNEATVRLGSLWIDGYDDDLFVSICLDDAFVLLLLLQPFFVNWIVPPDGVDVYIRALSFGSHFIVKFGG